VLGLVVITRTPIRVAADRTVAGVRRPLTDVIRPRIKRLFLLPEPRGQEYRPGDDTGLPYGLHGTPGLDDDTLEEEIDLSQLPAQPDDADEPKPTAGRRRKPKADHRGQPRQSE